MKEFDAMKNITDKFLAKADLFVLKQKIQQWLDVLNESGEAIEEMADRYPDCWGTQLKKYNQVIEEMYNTIKGE